MDASDPEAIQATIKLALDSYGRLDIMFNNAGMAEVGLVHDTTLESWNRVMAVTLTSTFLGIKYAVPIMRAQGGGAIINTASISGMQRRLRHGLLQCGQGRVINLTRAAALENAKHKIRINCVCPGGINTRVAEVLGGDRADDSAARWGRAIRSAALASPRK